MHFIKKVLRYAVLSVVALILLFEEWGWEPLQALLGKLARLPLWSRMERWLAALPPWAALLAFGIPFLVLLPFKVLALYLFAHRQVTLGLLVALSAKLAGTALLARLFHLLQPALMKLPWFARWYPRWKAWKDELLRQARASEPWQALQRARASARAWWARVKLFR